MVVVGLPSPGKVSRRNAEEEGKITFSPDVVRARTHNKHAYVYVMLDLCL